MISYLVLCLQKIKLCRPKSQRQLGKQISPMRHQVLSPQKSRSKMDMLMIRRRDLTRQAAQVRIRRRPSTSSSSRLLKARESGMLLLRNRRCRTGKKHNWKDFVSFLFNACYSKYYYDYENGYCDMFQLIGLYSVTHNVRYS